MAEKIWMIGSCVILVSVLIHITLLWGYSIVYRLYNFIEDKEGDDELPYIIKKPFDLMGVNSRSVAQDPLGSGVLYGICGVVIGVTWPIILAVAIVVGSVYLLRYIRRLQKLAENKEIK